MNEKKRVTKEMSLDNSNEKKRSKSQQQQRSQQKVRVEEEDVQRQLKQQENLSMKEFGKFPIQSHHPSNPKQEKKD